MEWGEFRIGDLFEVGTVKGLDEGKLSLEEQKQFGFIEFVGRTRNNNGIKGYLKRLEEIEPNQENVISVSQIGTIVAQIRNERYYASQNIFSLNPREGYENLISLYCISAINKSLGGSFSDGYGNYPTLDKLKNLTIHLPTKNNKIDFAFMENFIVELEAERIAELEAYLSSTGLKDYTLTTEEERVLAEFESEKSEWREFILEDLFEIVGTKSLDSNAIYFVDTGINFVGRTFEDNGIQGKIEKQSFEPNEPFSITATVIGNYKYVKYQREAYYCSQNVNKLTPKESITLWNKKVAYYFVANIQKFVSLYD